MLSRDLDYDLPANRIATAPAQPRDAARLMLVRRPAGDPNGGPLRIEHHCVRDLPKLGVFEPGDLLVVNQTRVIPALFKAVRAGTRGRIRGLYLESPKPDVWHVMLESRGTLRVGERIDLDESTQLKLVARRGGGEWACQLHAAGTRPVDPLALLGRIGVTPLPPYIRKARKQRHQPAVTCEDAASYNTVYATTPGSVAAPTAGLHFTEPLLKELDDMGVQRRVVTLHVGVGTFAPIRTDRVEDHDIHAEHLHVPPDTLAALHMARARGRRIIPVGTTTVRCLESLPDPLPDPADLPDGYRTDTNLLITPGFHFRFCDALMTNFHLPRSTLLALVAALPGLGLEQLKSCYQTAIDEGYRFYSYGDAMLIA